MIVLTNIYINKAINKDIRAILESVKNSTIISIINAKRDINLFIFDEFLLNKCNIIMMITDKAAALPKPSEFDPSMPKRTAAPVSFSKVIRPYIEDAITIIKKLFKNLIRELLEVIKKKGPTKHQSDKVKSNIAFCSP